MTQTQYNGHHQTLLLDGIRRLYDEQRYSDVVIHVANQTFPCHMLVLSAASAYFDAMFSSGMKETKEMTVTLHDIKPEVFRDVLSFIYHGNDVITPENVGDLLQVSSMLQLHCLTEKCEDFMIKNIDSENCLRIWKVAKSHNCRNLQEISEFHLLKRFDDVCSHSDLMLFDSEDIMAIVKSENLNVVSEENLCTAVLSWVQFDSENRKHLLSALFRYVNFRSVSLDYLLDQLDHHPLVVEDKECLTVVRNAIKYHALPAKRQAYANFNSVYRRNDETENVLAVIGKRVLPNGSAINEFIGYSFRQKRWVSMESIPFNIGEDFAVCAYGDDIYVTGGTEDLHTCIQFSAKFSQWRKRAPMACGRYRHSMVAVRDSLFVIGGYNFGTLSSVEEYDVNSESWKQVGDLQQSVDATSAAPLGDKIYIFGGWLGFAEETAAIQCFDTRSYSCTKISLLPKPCKFTRALLINDRINVMCATGELIAFSEKDESKVLRVVRDFSRKNFGFFMHDGEIFVIGGEKNEFSNGAELSTCDDVVKVGNQGVERVDDFRLPVAMEIFGCLAISVHKKYPLVDYYSVREFEAD